MMASQREYESVVWHFLGDILKTAPPAEVEEWFYDFVPNTDAQKNRWTNAISKVQKQIENFQGDDNFCAGENECNGLSMTGGYYGGS
jgi:hypothetical protein